MNRLNTIARAIAALLACLLVAPAMADQNKPPMIVELFTSQGCSSCPPANAFVGQLARTPNVIALTYAVDYWDYLGWRDTFAKPEFTQRQRSYARGLSQGGVYTPELVLNGAQHDSDGGAITKLMAKNAAPYAARVALDNQGQPVVSGAAPRKPADVWLVGYTPGPIYVSIRRGENAGVSLPHYNVVTKLQRLGQWSGGEQHFAGACARDCVVIVQEPDGGPVLGALQARS